MHKKSVPDKKTGARNRARSAASAREVTRRIKTNPNSINELLLRRPGLRRIIERLPQQQGWVEWLRGAAAAELAEHILGAVPKNGELVVFADTAAWATRLRYALAAMQPAIAGRDAAISRCSVRVQKP